MNSKTLNPKARHVDIAQTNADIESPKIWKDFIVRLLLSMASPNDWSTLEIKNHSKIIVISSMPQIYAE